MSEAFRDILETFENPHPSRDYVVETICPEFTSLCPKTGQPDFGTLTITYVPNQLCFELKSLKLYLLEYRNHGAFYEDVTNRILDDLVAVTQPRRMNILGEFTHAEASERAYALHTKPHRNSVTRFDNR